ncbi:cytochrome b/b6 domain-containing protein [Metallumcola ferriviriculae]|uniref:Cytochrome b/b6 domain-containing protein n=1 Tax=Metallumcola ferriviriculae TaxID=3039180 RepID=A0AAU0URG7_9FIRM|nr:cytochrome b/b6 domain-containing protein [Desulfitibacteraceae bacterium MK1]
MSTKEIVIPKKIKRWNRHQRYQHLLLALSVIMLVITGFPIKYGSWGWSQVVVDLFGSFHNMFMTHLTFGVIMLISGVYHLIWMVGYFARKGPSWAMVPTFKDVKDAVHHAKFLLGITKEPPRYDRYTYLEKFEYLAVFWGIIVMGGSGLILWFPGMFGWLTTTGLHITRIAHTNEAFVAMLAVVLGHFFSVHFNPHVFPSSKVWINGSISREHMEEEHLLEYEKLLEQYRKDGVPVVKHEHHSRFAKSRKLIIFELVVYVTVVILLMVTFIPLLFV